MEKPKLDDQYWNERWLKRETGWDIGYPSPALVDFVHSIGDKDTRILIPGCGNAYEAEYLHAAGFTSVFIVDFAEEALMQFSKRVPDFPPSHLICSDFFKVEEKPFDFILEQTFFCALDPVLRTKYVDKMSSLLHSGGVLAGLLFNDPMNADGPPFGGNIEEYRNLFSSHFSIRKLELCTNSIQPRAGREVWFEFVKA